MPFLVLLLGGVCIGFAPILVRLSDAGPVASAFWRMAIAAPILWLLLWARDRRRAARGAAETTQLPNDAAASAPSSAWRWPVTYTGVFFAFDLATWHWGITLTTVANATLLANLAPVLSTLYAVLVLRQRPGAGFISSMLMAFAGAAVLVGIGQGATHLAGDLLSVLAACFYTTYLILVKGLRDRLDTLRLMAWSTTVTAIVLLPMALALSTQAGQPFWPGDFHGWLVVLALALVTQVGGQSFIAYASAHLPVSLSTTGLLIQPVVAAFAAWLLFAESLSLMQIGGALILMTGIYFARRSYSG